MKALFAIILCTFIPNIVWADNIDSNSDIEVVVLMRDEIAPHTGLLVKEQRFTELLEIELKTHGLKVELGIEKRKSNTYGKMYDELLEEMGKKPWYKKPKIHRWLGFTLGIITTCAAFFLGYKLTKLMVEFGNI